MSSENAENARRMLDFMSLGGSLEICMHRGVCMFVCVCVCVCMLDFMSLGNSLEICTHSWTFRG